MTIWKRLAWMPNHEVSEDGVIRRAVKVRSHLVGEVNRQRLCAKGYSVASVDGRNVYAHRVVCEAFHGPAPSPKHQAAHGDGNKLNNHYTNLRWATCAENHADKDLHGTDFRGERHPRSTVTWEIVDAIRERYTGKRGEVVAIARDLGVSKNVVWDITQRRTWTKREVAA